MSRIIIKNLPGSGTSEDEIKKHFSDIDTVTDIKLKYNDTGTFRRFGFVGFKSSNAAKKAIEKLNNTFIKNNKIVLEECKSIRDNKAYKFIGKKLQDSDGDCKDQNHGTESTCKKSKITKQKIVDDVFDDVKDDPDFKEFLNLQCNLSNQNNEKHIWSDDTKMDIDLPKIERDKVECESTKAEQNTTDITAKPKKRHKRSRPDKKSTKVKPKELFIHTVKVNGFSGARRKDVKDFFKPIELLSVRLNKRDDVCYVSFRDENDLRHALKKNLQFWNTSRIKIWRHDVKKSRIFKETTREKLKERETLFKNYETSVAQTEPLEESGRLFVRNLNYTCTQDDLEEVFSKYGQLTEVHFPIDKQTSLPKGYAYVEFMFPENATRAYQELNGTIFQGRNFHLIPSKPKPEPKSMKEVSRPGGWTPKIPNSSFKRDKLTDQNRIGPSNTAHNWNILFLGQNPLADVVSEMKGVEKSKLLTRQSVMEPIAVRLALGDATMVEEMRKFLVSNGVELDSFSNPKASRSKTVIIVKNLPASVEKSELIQMFETHGRVARVILPPKGLSAIVEMEEAVEAKLAFKKLAYSKFKDSVLYLEWAPVNVFHEKSLEEQEDSDIKELENLQTGTKILVKNVPFEANPSELKKIFAAFGELNFVRVPKKIDGRHRGFGFVDFLTKEDALRAFRGLCHSTHLYGRKLVLEWAK